ncbi:MAG: calcium:proton antiporter [Planctomycetota bacterium]|nr:MAG: calcium:proton antiporter [Planctomycetota bacterium]
MNSSKPAVMPDRRKRWLVELPLVVGIATGVAVLCHWSPAGAINSGANMAWSLWMVACILVCAFRAMAHADALAEHFGEPLGTVILTISAITIEVAAVCAVMLGSDGDPTVARDTMFAVIMLILNLLLGLCMLVGGLKRGEQEFNPQSALSYLPMVIALGTIALILPRFTTSETGGWMSNPMELFVGVASLAIYVVFLLMQTTRHKEFFAHHGATERTVQSSLEANVVGEHHTPVSPWRAGTLLVVSLLAVVMIAEGLAGRVHGLLEALYIPRAIGGVFIAALVLAPEGFAAVRAAAHNEMQRSINVLLGSALATIGLTVPAVMVIRFATGVSPEFGLDTPLIVLLTLTFAVCALNLVRGRVNAMQGFVHILLFLAWIVTILDS